MNFKKLLLMTLLFTPFVQAVETSGKIDTFFSEALPTIDDSLKTRINDDFKMLKSAS